MTFGSVFTSLQVDSILSYVIAIVIPALDAIFPVLPSETAVIARGGPTAAPPDPRIALLVGCAALGAFLGDNLSYLIGRRFGPWADRRFFSSARGARQRAWAEQSLERYGAQLIIVCRFIPGGRTAVTLCCGLIGYPRRSGPPTRSSSAGWAGRRSRTTSGPGCCCRSASRWSSAPWSRRSAASAGTGSADGSVSPNRPNRPNRPVTGIGWLHRTTAGRRPA
jgi:membrane protein YqaA with SNARE-associated domain